MSDTGLIRDEAEIHSHVSRVEVIAQLEATLLGDPSLLLTGESTFRSKFHLQSSSSPRSWPACQPDPHLRPSTPPWPTFQDWLGLSNLDRKQGRPPLLQGAAEYRYEPTQNQISNNPKLQVLPSKKITVQPNRPPTLCCGRSQVFISYVQINLNKARL